MPEYCAYTYFKPHQRGKLEVTVSRTAYRGSWPAGQVEIDVGTVGINDKGSPFLARLVKQVRTLIENGTQKTLSFSVTTPIRVEIRVANPIPPTPSGAAPWAPSSDSCSCPPVAEAPGAAGGLGQSQATQSALSRSGCLRTKRMTPAQCQSVRRVSKRLSVTAMCVVPDDPRGRDVPALPASPHRPVLEVDVLSVEPEALVEAAELVEHRPAQEQESAEHPVGLRRLRRRRLVEVEVAALARTTPRSGVRLHDRAPVTVGNLRREGCEQPSRIDHRRPGDTAARMTPMKSRSAADRARVGHRVGVDRERRRRPSCVRLRD